MVTVKGRSAAKGPDALAARAYRPSRNSKTVSSGSATVNGWRRRARPRRSSRHSWCPLLGMASDVPGACDRNCLTWVSVSYNLPFVETYGAAGVAALGDPTRRAIFESLARRPKAVGEL